MQPERPLPPVDERLVAPGTRYEIEDGRVRYVPHNDEPRGLCHANLAAILVAHRHPLYRVALRLLTRVSLIDDFAPDACVFPIEEDPHTGGRQLEELAFEIAATESLGHSGARAAKLIARGVRRVFAIDLSLNRALEWSIALDWWSPADRDGEIIDRALAVPLPIAALLKPA